MKIINEYTEKDITLIEFREKLLRDVLEKYLNTITGEKASIRPFVTDEKGSYSEEKCWEFIEELTKCAHIYNEVENASLYREKIESLEGLEDLVDEMALNYHREYAFDVFGPRKDFTKEEKQFIQDFLYVVIRNGEFNYSKTNGGSPQLFEDFIIGAEEHYKDLGELYGEEAYSDAYEDDYSNLKKMYSTASYITKCLTDEAMTDKFTEAERKKYYININSKLREDFEKEGCTKPSEFMEHIGCYISFSDVDFRDFPEQTKDEKDDESIQELFTAFSNKNEFVKRYMRFRNVKYDEKYKQDFAGALDADQLRLAALIDDFGNAMKMAVRLFTESNGISYFQDDDVYFTASATLKNSDKRLMKLLKGKQGDIKHE